LQQVEPARELRGEARAGLPPHRFTSSDGDKVVPKTATPTLYVGLDLYLKQGNYRAVSDERSVLHVHGMRKGFTRKVVSSR
jgi:hypothetical protein